MRQPYGEGCPRALGQKVCCFVFVLRAKVQTDTGMHFRKRTLDAKSFYPQKAAVSLWMPLIRHIESLHTGFITVLVTQLTWQLLNEPVVPGSGTSPARDGSYDSFVAAWAIYLVDTETSWARDRDVDQGLMSKANIIQIVMGGLGPLGLSTLSERKT